MLTTPALDAPICQAVDALPSRWMDEGVLARFVGRIDVLDNGCWEWAGTIAGGGYGYFKALGTGSFAHIAAFTQWVGEVPVGMQLDHLCHSRNPCSLGVNCRHRRCVRPDHLEPVTASTNTRRGRGPIVAAERELSKTECPRGHMYDEANTYHRPGLRKRKCRACNRERERAFRETGSRHLAPSGGERFVGALMPVRPAEDKNAAAAAA